FIGFLNTYFFVRNGNFTTEQYGLTRLMNDIANVFFSFSTLGVVPFIYKFYPYYHDNLPKAKNDQVAISVSILSL
ncbi:MAG TPA: polysaccharide biosynthesis protein, partial [Chitinophagaceae bacterium]|nr:polysaccharide biosynthesis protein [Chitinophagaceae bacterium]